MSITEIFEILLNLHNIRKLDTEHEMKLAIEVLIDEIIDRLSDGALEKLKEQSKQ